MFYATLQVDLKHWFPIPFSFFLCVIGVLNCFLRAWHSIYPPPLPQGELCLWQFSFETSVLLAGDRTPSQWVLLRPLFFFNKHCWSLSLPPLSLSVITYILYNTVAPTVASDRVGQTAERKIIKFWMYASLKSEVLSVLCDHFCNLKCQISVTLNITAIIGVIVQKTLFNPFII